MNKKIGKIFFNASLALLASAYSFCHTVNDDNVRCRTLPSLKYSQVVKKLNRGAQINVREIVADDDDNNWYRFSCDEGDLWIYADFVDSTSSDKCIVYTNSRTQIYARRLDSEMHSIAVKESEEKTYSEISKNSQPVERMESGIRNPDGPSTKIEYQTFRTDYGTICFLVIPSQKKIMLISADFEKDFSNSFGIKIGDSLDKIKEIFGNDYTTEYTLGEITHFIIKNVYSEFDGLRFTIDKNNCVKSITINRNGGLGN